SARRLAALLATKHAREVAEQPSILAAAVEFVLEDELPGGPRRADAGDPLAGFRLAMTPNIYSGVLDDYKWHDTFAAALARMPMVNIPDPAALRHQHDDHLQSACAEVASVFAEQAHRESEVWATTLEPWSAVVEASRRKFGT